MSERVGICPKCLKEYTGPDTVCPNDAGKLVIVESSKDPRVGQVIDDKLTITGPLGKGGMGTVYRAVQHSMQREVAIKMLHKELSDDIVLVRRFLQEARSASALSHPNIITLFDFGQCATGELYIVMELLSGHTLKELLLQSGALSPPRAINLLHQICDALQAAHDAEIIHRDLKPDNIFILSGAGSHGEFVKVLDFGIAKMLEGRRDAALTKTGYVCGTPAYMSPEQARSEPVDGRSDVYSAALVLYEMLAGAPPFSGDTPTEVMMHHIRDTPTPIRNAHPYAQVSAELDAQIMRALAKEPNHRPASARAFKDKLLRAMESHQSTPVDSAVPVESTLKNEASLTVESSPLAAIDETVDARPSPALDTKEDASNSTAPLENGAMDTTPKLAHSGAGTATWLVIALLVTALCAVGYVQWGEKGQDTDGVKQRDKSPHTEVRESAKPSSKITEEKAVVPLEKPVPKPAASVERTKDTVSKVESPVGATIAVKSTPRGATIVVDGVTVGETPFKLSSPKKGISQKMQIRKAGYQTVKRIIRSETGTVDVVLRKRAARPRPLPDFVP